MIVRGTSLRLIVFFSAFFAAIFVLYHLRDPYKPLHHLQQENFPYFIDDLDRQSMLIAATRQLVYLEKLVEQDESKTFTIADANIPVRWFRDSMVELIRIFKQDISNTQLNAILHRDFELFQAGGRKKNRGRQMLVTGYYEPLFPGQLTQDATYRYPVYSVPDSLVSVVSGDGKKKIGRYDERQNFVDYWSRAEIENGDLLRGFELAFLKDPMDAYLLHVQGSGRIQLPDGTIRSIRFASSNGLNYNSIGKLLVDENILKLDEVSVPAIRAYLAKNPKERQRILQHNPRFIFFDWGDRGEPGNPKGSNGLILTPGRSIALDQKALPVPTLGYLITQKPVVDKAGKITDWTGLHRFVFPQDSGSAIKGTGRVDIFWGNGQYAETAANHMAEPGELYFLVKKGYQTKR